jgi:hypothetical protein
VNEVIQVSTVIQVSKDPWAPPVHKVFQEIPDDEVNAVLEVNKEPLVSTV